MEFVRRKDKNQTVEVIKEDIDIIKEELICDDFSFFCKYDNISVYHFLKNVDFGK